MPRPHTQRRKRSSEPSCHETSRPGTRYQTSDLRCTCRLLSSTRSRKATPEILSSKTGRRDLELPGPRLGFDRTREEDDPAALPLPDDPEPLPELPELRELLPLLAA